MRIRRSKLNPLITTLDVKPSREGFKVDGVFNAGVTEYNGDVILLLRVAESLKNDDANIVKIPILAERNGKYGLEIKEFNRKEDNYDFSDSRSVWSIAEGNKQRQIVYLTSLSHIRLARSKDGENFTIDENPFIYPGDKHEVWGIEDPRVTEIDGTYFINYTAVSQYGAATALITTRDFKTYERHGVIYPPENKDVSIFPEKINGKYYAYHRPVPKAIGNPDIWVSTSPDLYHWGNHKHLISVNEDTWENGRIGGGAPSFKTEKGWIHIYHAADKDDRYCLGAFIASLDDPAKIIAKTDKPIVEPEEDYELYGFFGNVVFTCGLIYKDNVVKIYYGAADEVIALVEINIEDIFNALGV